MPQSSRERVGRLCRHADEALNNWKNSNLKVAKVPWKLQDNDPKAHEDTRKTQVPPSDPRISLVPNLGLCCKLWAWESPDSRSPQLVGERYLMGFTKGRRNSGQKKNTLIPAQSNGSITICAAPYVLSTMKILITEKIIFFKSCTWKLKIKLCVSSKPLPKPSFQKMSKLEFFFSLNTFHFPC